MNIYLLLSFRSTHAMEYMELMKKKHLCRYKKALLRNWIEIKDKKRI